MDSEYGHDLLEKIHSSWRDKIFTDDILKEYYEAIKIYQQEQNITPHREYLLRSFKFNLDDLKVIILGQDPYQNPDHARGIAFESPKDTQSLRFILESLKNCDAFKYRDELPDSIRDITIEPKIHGKLDAWCQQGILMMNAALTTQQGKPVHIFIYGKHLQLLYYAKHSHICIKWDDHYMYWHGVMLYGTYVLLICSMNMIILRY